MMAFIPIALAIGGAIARAMGAVADVATVAILLKISGQLAVLGQAGVFQAGFMKVADAMTGLQYVGLQVYIVNQDFLDHVAATRWAISYLSYVTSLKMLEALGDLHRDLLTVQNDIFIIGTPLLAVATASYSILVAILEELRRILAQLIQGITANLRVTMAFDTGPLANFFNQLDLLKFLGFMAILLGFLVILIAAMAVFGAEAILGAVAIGMVSLALALLFWALSKYSEDELKRIALALGMMVAFVALMGLVLMMYDWKKMLTMALGLAVIAGFVWALRKSLEGLHWDALKEMGAALAGIVIFVFLLTRELDKYDWKKLAQIGLGLALIALFVAGLGWALRLYNAEVLKALPSLGKLLEQLSAMAKMFAEMKGKDFATMAGGFAVLAAFMVGLGYAMRLFNAETLNALPGLASLLEQLSKMAMTFAKLKGVELLTMLGGFAILAAFLTGIGFAMRLFNAETLKALPGLSGLLDQLNKMAMAFAKLKGVDLLTMLGGFAIIAAFVAGLGFAMRLFNADVLRALPGLSGLLNQLNQMAMAFAAIKGVDLLTMAGGFAIVALFVAGLGWALKDFNVQVLQALGPLSDLLGTILNMAVAFSNMDIGQLIKMGVALALIAGFVWLLALAIDFATPGLLALAEVLKALNAVMDKLAAAASALGSALDWVISKLPSLSGLGGAFGGLGGLLGGGGLSALGGLVSSVAAPISTESMAAALPSAAPPGGLGGPSSIGRVDQSVNVQGGIAVHIAAERLEADSAQLLSDQLIQKLQERLGALRSEQDFRGGVRAAAPA